MPLAQRHRTEHRKPVLLLLALLSVVLAYANVFGRHGLGRYLALREDLSERAEQASRHINRNRDLRERLDGLRTDERVLEEAARSTLGVVDDDEIVIVFRDREPRRR